MSLLRRLIPRFGRKAPSLSCEQVAAVLQEYLDGELEPAEVPKVLAHLEQCRDCGLEYELYLRIKTSLHAHRQEPSADSLARMQAMAEQLAASGPGDD